MKNEHLLESIKRADLLRQNGSRADASLLLTRTRTVAEIASAASVEIGDAMAAGMRPDIILSPLMRSVFWGHAVFLSLPQSRGIEDVKFAWCKYGYPERVMRVASEVEELFVREPNVLIVVEGVSTGNKARETAAAARKAGGNPIGVLAIFNPECLVAENIGVEYLMSVFEGDCFLEKQAAA